MKSIYIDGKSIKEDGPCFIIAEIGQAHDGSLGSAHAYIDAVAEAGVDAVKFQTHIAHAESSKHEQFRVKGFPQDKTRYDYWKRMEFTPEQWSDLLSHAKEKGLIFLSTPFSIEAVELLENLNVPAFKIGSGDIDNIDLIESVIKTQKPILLSSGMSSPINMNLFRPAEIATTIDRNWVDITDKTSSVMRLNSSKQPHVPLMVNPLKILPTER